MSSRDITVTDITLETLAGVENCYVDTSKNYHTLEAFMHSFKHGVVYEIYGFRYVISRIVIDDVAFVIIFQGVL